MTGAERTKSLYQQAIGRVLERLDNSGLPWPNKPKDYGASYDFPSDPTALPYQALGQLQARLAAWHGYAIRLLAIAEIDHDVLQGRFDIALSMKMATIEAEAERRALKDTLRAQALGAEGDLHKAALSLVERAAYVKGLKAQAGIFEQQARSLSREQSRRSDEMRMRGNTG